MSILRLFGNLLFLLSFAPLSAQASLECPGRPEAQFSFSPNAITTSLLTGGDLWWNGNNGEHDIALPGAAAGDRPLTTIFAGALWLTATNGARQQLIRAQQYGRGGGNFDYAPGPLAPGGVVDRNECLGWDKFFPVTRQQIDSAVAADVAAGSFPINPANLPVAVLGWPGLGNPYFTEVHGLTLPDDPRGYAPFVDADGDGIYNPTRGDVPAFIGDQAVWFLFSTARIARESGVPFAFPVEIHVLAYGAHSTDASLDQTIYYDYTLISRGDEDYLNLRAGLWMDIDIGCFTNDQAGSIPEDNLFYAYQDESRREECSGNVVIGDNKPVNIIKYLNAPNLRDMDEETALMEQFTIYGLPQGNGQTGTPFYGRWPDGTPLTRGGFGYNPGSADTTMFVFDGQEVNGIPWEMCSVDQDSLVPSDLRVFSNLLPVNLSPGERHSFSFAVTTSFDVPHEGACPDRTAIRNRAATVQQYYNEGRAALTTATRTPAAIRATTVTTYPNPARSTVNFRLPAGHIARHLELFDLSGRSLGGKRVTGRAFSVDLRQAALPAGTYVYRIRTVVGGVLSGKISVMP